MVIIGQYVNEVKLDDEFTLAFELTIEGAYVYEASTMYDRNGDPGDPGYEETSIEDYSIDCYSLIDKNGDEVTDMSLYKVYESVVKTKIREIFDSLNASDVDWGEPELDYEP